ncbi:MAG: glycosyltransferase family 9 protein [Williamsia sp.]|nr:glycosyltransferase family 9 protein [Williamsia sp.]
MKFLVIRFSSIGDIVLTTPVIRCLKKQIATAEVHFLTKQAYHSITDSNPYIDKCYYLNKELDALMNQLRSEDYDYIIDLHHNLRTAKVKKALGKPSFSFNKLNIEKWLYTALKWNRMPDLHIVDRYMQTVQAFGVINDGAGLDYFIPEDQRVKESDIPTSHLAGYIGVVIGAAHNTKKYPLHKLQAFCGQIKHPLILLGGKEDYERGQQIAAADPVKVYNACGKFTLNESADLVRRARLVVTNDTGLMHIAAAFKRKIVSLWGNTVPEFGMVPYYGSNFLSSSKNQQGPMQPPADILEVRPLWCRPCSKIGYSKCPLGHFKCMEKIDATVLLTRVNERLGLQA